MMKKIWKVIEVIFCIAVVGLLVWSASENSDNIRNKRIDTFWNLRGYYDTLDTSTNQAYDDLDNILDCTSPEEIGEDAYSNIEDTVEKLKDEMNIAVGASENLGIAIEDYYSSYVDVSREG